MFLPFGITLENPGVQFEQKELKSGAAKILNNIHCTEVSWLSSLKREAKQKIVGKNQFKKGKKGEFLWRGDDVLTIQLIIDLFFRVRH